MKFFRRLFCHTIQLDLTAFLDNEFTAGRRNEIQAHLQACASCQAHRDGLGDTRSIAARALSAYPKVKASAGFDRRVWGKLAQRREAQLCLFDRCDALFARPLVKLLASGSGGILFGAAAYHPAFIRQLSAAGPCAGCPADHHEYGTDANGRALP